jgi:predicted Abi (CAAX) family protease
MAWTRVLGSATLVPSGHGMRAFILGILFETATVLPFGVASGMLQWPPRRTKPISAVVLALGKVMLAPGIMEELLFRALTIDVQMLGFEDRSQTWWGTVVASLLVFSFPYHVDAFHHLTAPDVFKVVS